MRILHCVEAYYPSVGGMQEAVKQISEGLVKLGHSVTVATGKEEERNFSCWNGVEIKEFQVSGNMVSGYKGDWESYKKFLLHEHHIYDVVTFFAAQQWATDIALPVLKQIESKKVSVPTGYSGLYRDEYRDYFERMKTWIHDYDMNVYLAENYRDINFARDCLVNRIVVIPNGAAMDEFERAEGIDIRRKFNIRKKDFLILHVGTFTGSKGHKEAVEIFLRSEIRNGVLLLVGERYGNFWRQFLQDIPLLMLRIMRKLRSLRIICTHVSRQETVAAFKQADLLLFPSNIECSPIVLFEAMASKTPFMTTDVGNAAEIVRWSGGGVVMPTVIDEHGYSHADIGESVRMLNRLYFNMRERIELAEAGYRSWKENFTWEDIARKYEKLYLSLLAG